MTTTPSHPFSAAADRNKQVLLETLQRLLPPTGQMLELAAGTGQHAVHWAAALPGWRWWPSDADDQACRAIAARHAEAGLPNLQPPRLLDVLQLPWNLPGAMDAVFCANMLHIAPWRCCAALMQGAALALSPGGQLITYGPYLVRGEDTAPSNLAFDADLRRRDPEWGIRWLHDMVEQAHAAGLELRQRLAMPANNQLLAFARAGSPAA